MKENPQMDAAAEEFAKELDKLPKDTVRQFADLWKQFYLTAGHKRMGRKLLERATNMATELEELVKD